MDHLTIKVFLLAVLIAFPILTTSGQTSGNREQRQIRIVDYAGDLLSFLTHLPKTYDVTIGFEVDPLEPRSYVTFGVRNAKLEDVMDAIVKNKPSYTWRGVGNAVEVYPTDRPHPLLETRINSFRVEDVSAAETLQQLLALNEVQQAMTVSKLRLAQSNKMQPEQGDRLSINFEAITLREALDRIAERSGLKFWVFRITGPHREYVSIRFDNLD